MFSSPDINEEFTKEEEEEVDGPEDDSGFDFDCCLRP